MKPQFSLRRLLVLVTLVAIAGARAPDALPTMAVAAASGLSAFGLFVLGGRCARYNKDERPIKAFGRRLVAVPSYVVCFFLAVFSVAAWMKAIAIALGKASA